MTDLTFSLRSTLFAGLGAIALLGAGLGGWAALTEIEGAVVASAVVEVAAEESVVQHPEGGVVSDVMVREGESVAAGATLLRFDPTRIDAEIAEADSQYFEFLARRARLEAERDGRAVPVFPPELEARAAEDPDVAELMEGQVRFLDARADALARAEDERRLIRARLADDLRALETERRGILIETEIVAEELADQQSLLDQGLVQMSRVRNLRRTEAQLATQLETLEARTSATRIRIEEIAAEAARMAQERRADVIGELREVRARTRLLAAERAALAEDRRRLEIVAPVAGVIHDLRVTAARAVIAPRDPIMTLVPQDETFRVMARIAPADIDRVWRGQPVTLQLTALDQRRTPRVDGEVRWVSADALVDPQQGTAYYRAEIAFAAEQLPEGASLVPGMPVEAFLRTGARTPMSYLLKPLTDYMTRAFREA
ncbi:Type I secretion system membrane fusion protein PrsE [Roseivivax sp. THAF40]|uniref:HlyD family type I secretion periplasmic adaptor subunit n=1 Tax=unclassified Roseivivax TaxID=2639302 RepID=UPI00126880E3|nr:MULTISPECIES: HlyD family type I secretion periplasmic adaptor subunit [unclassified Roseivivax]QFS84322.1 Type I secretion system membrane fusion protein PrsE [Roseivivax sp. THAF197b]QFT48150.1 Type I secretion system membrane fusion protein PrsE [Roseivivax sp. THAF40]